MKIGMFKNRDGNKFCVVIVWADRQKPLHWHWPKRGKPFCGNYRDAVART